MSAHDYSFEAIDGDTAIDLKAFAGKAILVINTRKRMRIYPSVRRTPGALAEVPRSRSRGARRSVERFRGAGAWRGDGNPGLLRHPFSCRFPDDRQANRHRRRCPSVLSLDRSDSGRRCGAEVEFSQVSDRPRRWATGLGSQVFRDRMRKIERTGHAASTLR